MDAHKRNSGYTWQPWRLAIGCRVTISILRQLVSNNSDTHTKPGVQKSESRKHLYCGYNLTLSMSKQRLRFQSSLLMRDCGIDIDSHDRPHVLLYVRQHHAKYCSKIISISVTVGQGKTSRHRDMIRCTCCLKFHSRVYRDLIQVSRHSASSFGLGIRPRHSQRQNILRGSGQKYQSWKCHLDNPRYGLSRLGCIAHIIEPMIRSKLTIY